MHVLIASSSAFRRELYQQAIRTLGHDISMAESGLDCVNQLRVHQPDLLMLEAPLLWGGTEGVLEVFQELNAVRPMSTRIVVVAAGTGSIDWFQLSRFRVDDVLFRLPTAHELQRAIGVAEPSPAPPRFTRPGQQTA
jgi:CheY-like chemotaxis protein